jgi:hypothetical protein
VLGAWNLEFVWDLVLGAWNLFFCLEFVFPASRRDDKIATTANDWLLISYIS